MNIRYVNGHEGETLTSEGDANYVDSAPVCWRARSWPDFHSFD